MAGAAGGWGQVISGEGKQELAPRHMGGIQAAIKERAGLAGGGTVAALARETRELLSAFSLQPHAWRGASVHGAGWENRSQPGAGWWACGYGGKRVPLGGMLSRYLLHPQITSGPRLRPAVGTTATSSACTSSRRTRPSP